MASRIPLPMLPLLMLPALMASGLARAAAPAVPVTHPRPAVYRAEIEVAGEVAAVKGAVLAASQAGRVASVDFTSGEMVKQGAVLVRLDDEVEQARIALDEAKRLAARRTLARDLRLRAIAGVAQAQLEAAEAVVAETTAQIALDRAKADKLRIIAPFAGRLGIRRVSPGDYLQPGGMVASITQTSPLRVLFSVPETELDGLKPGDGFTISVPQGGAHRGEITALSPRISAKTRARMVEGRLANAAGALLPGMSGTVRLRTGAAVAAFSVPATALNYGPVGSYLYAVSESKGDAVVHAVYVHVLSSVGKEALVRARGLNAAGEIVALGGFRLREGETVRPIGAGSS